MAPGVFTCTSCGRASSPLDRFCVHCGQPSDLGLELGQPAGRDAAVPTATIAGPDVWNAVLPRVQEALFGEFAITRELGRGGMAVVFLAHQLKLNRKVAIKVMAPALTAGAALIERFRDEALTVAKLDHPNIISIYAVGEAAGLQYFVMRYVAGRSLERVVRQYGPLPLDVIRAILFDVGSALSYAHREHVIHRDVKPGNILLSVDGRAIVSDFGIAKVAESSVRTQTGVIVGTPSYMSPEQCLGIPITWSADQYSLGIVAYEMLTGGVPFTGASYTVMRGHTDGSTPPILPLRGDCPADVAAAVTRMLAKRPADRFGSMSEALAALGASRLAIDERVQEQIGRLALPLAGEQGTVLVHTPASPVPRHEPSNQFRSAAGQQASPEMSASASHAEPHHDGGTRRWREMSAARAALRRMSGARAALRETSAALAARARAVVTRMRGRRRFWLVAAGTATAAVVVLGAVLLWPGNGGGAASRDVGGQPPSRAAGPPASGSVPPSPAEPDSVRSPKAEETLGRTDIDSVDAAAPVAPPARVLTLRISRPSETVEVGDSLRLRAIVRDESRQAVPDVVIRWRVAPRNVATMDSATGVLRARGAGRATVTAVADGLSLTARTVVIVAPRGTSRAAMPAPDTLRARDERLGEKSDSVPPASAERQIDRAVAAFVQNVLDRGDVTGIRDLYIVGTPADGFARDALIRLIREKPNLRARPQANWPPPSISGDHASAELQIELKWRRLIVSKDREKISVRTELRRVGDDWQLTGFRITNLPWPR